MHISQVLNILHRFGVCISTTSIYRLKQKLSKQHDNYLKSNIEKNRQEQEKHAVMQKHLKTASVSLTDTDVTAASEDHQYAKSVIDTAGTSSCEHSYDHGIYYAAGDNVDVSIVLSYMTSTNQRKSFHWFLMLGIEKRVLNNTLSNDRPKCDIRDLPSSSWLLDQEELLTYERDINFHIVQILLKFKCMKCFSDVVESNISHPYIENTKKPSKYHVVTLSDDNENTSEGMINVMKKIHSVFVPRDKDTNCILDSVDFAGDDVLTNERALSAQESMMNRGASDYDQLTGLNHRSGGLHLQMNLTAVWLT